MKKITLILPFLISTILINAQFGPNQIASYCDDPYSVHAADLDNDGDLDILAKERNKNFKL